MEEEKPTDNFLWLVQIFGVVWLFATVLSALLGLVPWSHGAYFREICVPGLTFGVMSAALAGLVRPAGWLALAGMVGVGFLLSPHVHSRGFLVFLVVASYFNLYFCFWSRLTLLRLLAATGLTSLFLLAGYWFDAGRDAHDGWVWLIAEVGFPCALVLLNGLVRFLMPSFFVQAQTPKLLEPALFEATQL